MVNQVVYFSLIILLPTLAGSSGVDVGICSPRIVECKCGNGIHFQVKEKQCTFFYKWRPSCQPCSERSDEQICAQFKYCQQCDPETPDKCATCPIGKYGTWCVLNCECQNGGNCDREGKCSCPPNFAGNSCEIGLDPPGVCPRPSVAPANAFWEIFGDKGKDLVSPGALLIYKCHSEFTLKGETTLTCRHDGTWSAAVPQCVSKPKDCPPVEPVLGGRITIILPTDDPSHSVKLNEQSADSLLGPYKENTQLIYKCESNFYSLIGATHRVCLPTGKWSGRAPICFPMCGRSSAPRTPFLTHGQPSEIGQWPWQVALEMDNGTDWIIGCGASLISERWVLTAAHCVHFPGTKTILNSDRLRLYFGKHFRNNSQDDVHVIFRKTEEILVHPDFNYITLDSDIALIRVTTVQFSSRVQPICLPDPSTDESDVRLVKGNLGTVTGWGVKEDGNLSSVLAYIRVPVVPLQECRDAYKKINISVTLTKNMFCAGYEKGVHDSCSGDSGGPIVFPVDKQTTDRWVLEGVVSWGSLNGCGQKEQYGAYVRVLNYVNWIKHNTGL